MAPYLLNLFTISRGFGLLNIEGIRTVDYPIIMSVAVVGTLIIFISNFVVDMIYPILDPRVRVQ